MSDIGSMPIAQHHLSQKLGCSFGKWCSPLLITFTPYDNGGLKPIDVLAANTSQFTQSHTAISKEANDTL